MLEVLLKAEAARFSGCEFLPAVAVAVPVAGRAECAANRAAAFYVQRGGGRGGVDADLGRAAGALLKEHRAGDVGSGIPQRQVVDGAGAGDIARRGWADPVPLQARTPEAEAAPLSGAASTKAEGGNPPMVAASPAFSA